VKAIKGTEALMKAIKMVLVAILVVGTIIGATSCGGKTGDGELQTYSGHGFSFKYPKTFEVFSDETLENGGFVVMVSRDDFVTHESQTFMVAGGRGQPQINGETLDLNQYLEFYSDLNEWGAEEGVEYLWSPMQETTQSGHRVIYRCYTETSSDVLGNVAFMHYGVMAVFFCDKSYRTFLLQAYSTHTVIDSWTEAWEDFTIYLDSFVCH
jgi:hypothetical protein